MKVAIASGKGGTGKTALTLLLAENCPGTVIVDCDVEEPNCHLYMMPEVVQESDIAVMRPEIQSDQCTGCGLCSVYCLFNAIAIAGGKAMVFDELCHSCGGCILVCPASAIVESQSNIGKISVGMATQVATGKTLITGLLNVGTPTAGPLIRAMKKTLPTDKDIIIDCPPGTSCSMVAAIAGCDYCILVTEPTPFGLHDLNLALGITRLVGIPAGVVINKSDGGLGNQGVYDLCREHSIQLLSAIPYSEEVAAEYAAGRVPRQFAQASQTIWHRIKSEVAVR